jgi:hypothetical protein
MGYLSTSKRYLVGRLRRELTHSHFSGFALDFCLLFLQLVRSLAATPARICFPYSFCENNVTEVYSTDYTEFSIKLLISFFISALHQY